MTCILNQDGMLTSSYNSTHVGREPSDSRKKLQ